MTTPTPARYHQCQPLAPLTTLHIGGPCTRLVEVEDASRLAAAFEEAVDNAWKVFFLGEGSNVLFPDRGFRGLVVRNRIGGVEASGDLVTVGSGENLGRLVRWANARGLEGLERLFGIPGSVGGAVVGNAGAYGQEIGPRVVSAEVWTGDGLETWHGGQLAFDYRHSLLKERRDCFLVRCTLGLRSTHRPLQEISDAILAKRLEKYPPELRSPGSFFKNVPVGTLSATALEAIPNSFIQFGKVPAGCLLEAVGANGAQRGGAAFASYHGNLLMNVGAATSQDIIALAREFSDKVRDRFGVQLEPEIDIVGDQWELHEQD